MTLQQRERMVRELHERAEKFAAKIRLLGYCGDLDPRVAEQILFALHDAERVTSQIEMAHGKQKQLHESAGRSADSGARIPA